MKEAARDCAMEESGEKERMRGKMCPLSIAIIRKAVQTTNGPLKIDKTGEGQGKLTAVNNTRY